MVILVTGSKGQLGSEIKRLSDYQINRLSDKIQGTSNHEIIFTDVEELDITDYAAVEKFVNENKPEQIINCAAYTAVDKAESEEDLARLINVKACLNLAKICSKEGILLIHVSTDYVFDGNNYIPYKEDDKTNPLSAYGRTKLEGEREIIKELGMRNEELGIETTTNYQINKLCAIIIRTSWLYSSFGNNFVKSIIKYAKERGKLNVVYDQVGSPTYARDLAKAILVISDQCLVSRKKNLNTTDQKLNTNLVEIYNFSNEGVCSWYDFAKTIVELKNIPCIINPIETKDYPTPAKRPHYSVFSKDKIKNDFNIDIPYWRDSLKEMLNVEF